MIAMFLPLPIVIVDPELAMWQKVGAFVGPGTVQGYGASHPGSGSHGSRAIQ
jgi:hypothetical protein